jgi:ribosomal protein S27E
VNMGDVDPHAWFTGEELASCPACGERAAIPVLASRSVLCLACGSVTATEVSPKAAESGAAIDGVRQSQQHS